MLEKYLFSALNPGNVFYCRLQPDSEAGDYYCFRKVGTNVAEVLCETHPNHRFGAFVYFCDDYRVTVKVETIDLPVPKATPAAVEEPFGAVAIGAKFYERIDTPEGTGLCLFHKFSDDIGICMGDHPVWKLNAKVAFLTMHPVLLAIGWMPNIEPTRDTNDTQGRFVARLNALTVRQRFGEARRELINSAEALRFMLEPEQEEAAYVKLEWMKQQIAIMTFALEGAIAEKQREKAERNLEHIGPPEEITYGKL